ncbi:hypothetical protein XELAEV_18002604mg [Xenopus laevis]|nr:hypothetical protein XELAEV_18002604mg [Xenopus laevis]
MCPVTTLGEAWLWMLVETRENQVARGVRVGSGKAPRGEEIVLEASLKPRLRKRKSRVELREVLEKELTCPG